MLVSHAHKFAYFGMPKTGTKTTTLMLKKRYGAQNRGSYHGAKWDALPDGYLPWMTVRNPWTRLLSWWHAWGYCANDRDVPVKDIGLLFIEVSAFHGFAWAAGVHTLRSGGRLVNVGCAALLHTCLVEAVVAARVQPSCTPYGLAGDW